MSNRRHVLDLDDFSREEIEEVLQNADVMKEVLSRDIRKVPTLRGKTIYTLFYEGQHQDTGIVRAGWQGDERGRDQRVRRGLQRGEGRIAVRHGPYASGHERRYDYRATCTPGRAVLPGAQLGRAHHQRGGRGTRPPDAGAPRYIHDAVALGTNRRSEGGDRRRHSIQPRRALESLGPHQNGGARDLVRAADTDATRLHKGVPRRAPFRGSHHREQR